MGSSIVLKSLSILLGVFFVFVGITKLTPIISKELHKDLYLASRLLSQLKRFFRDQLLRSRTCFIFWIITPLCVRKEYVRYAKVFPLTEFFDFKLPSKWYRRGVGGLEILFGLIMALIPSHKLKNTANIGLVLMMILAAYSHVMVGDPFDRCAPALVFFFMLSGRLVVWYQTTRREELEKAAATATNGNGLKRD